MSKIMTIARKQKWEEKQLCGHFKRVINNISLKIAWTWLRKGNFKRDTVSPSIAVQNNGIRSNHIKTKTDITQQDSSCRLCNDWEETINHIISECSKLTQKEYKPRNDCVGKGIHCKMCKKFKFDNTNKCNKHNPAPVLEYNRHKIILDFDTQTDPLI